MATRASSSADSPARAPRYPSGTPKVAAAALQVKNKDDGLIRELYRRRPNDVWAPSFSVAVRMLILVRVCGAMYSSVVADCDEVYNYWEPLHFILHGQGFRTWEYSPAYAIRSWAYILLHAAPAKLFSHVNPTDKRVAFFTVRIALAGLSTVCECRFYRSVVENVGARIGRYTLVFLMVSAGMYNAATAFLPSTFAMYFVLLGFSYALQPVNDNSQRTLRATISFTGAAVLGWPFTALLAVPLVFEELFLRGHASIYGFVSRSLRLVKVAHLSFLLLGMTIAIDSFAYGKLTVVPWNIIRYNALSSSNPELYGVSPWYFYILNGILNFNLVLPLALMSLPLLALTAVGEPKKLGITKPGQTSSAVLLSLRLLPFYLWFGLLSAQPHKEERFMFPAFPLACLNAAVSLGFIRGWMQMAYVKITKAPFNAARSSIFGGITGAILLLTAIISFARIMALQSYYRAPMSLLHHFQYTELPALALHNHPERYPGLDLTNFMHSETQFDLSPLQNQNLTLCYGAEWYRFPSSFLVPNLVRIEFLQTKLGMQLPKHFVERRDDERISHASYQRRLAIMRDAPQGYNDANTEMQDRYVPAAACSYIIDLDFPDRRTKAKLELQFSHQEWERVTCQKYLDSALSPALTRSFSIPTMDQQNSYGDFCLLRSRRLHGASP